MKTIRLGCLLCDRDDFDGVDEIPAAWFSVDEVQSLAASMREAGLKDDPFNWQTHLSVCPKCQETELWPSEASVVSE